MSFPPCPECDIVYSSYIASWGIVGNRFGGWKFTPDPDQMIGNAGISGATPNKDWSAIRGGFVDSFTPDTNKALIVRGKVEFVGGGFEAPNSFRFGIFQSNSTDFVVDSIVDSTHWSGNETDHYDGYLFIPPSGTKAIADWNNGMQGTTGAVKGDVWFKSGGANNYALGSFLQSPQNTAATAGKYIFAISVSPKNNGTSEIRYTLIKEDSSYIFSGKIIDNHSPVATDKFNCIAFALDSGNTTTAMILRDVKIDMGNPIDILTNVEEPKLTTIPVKYDLQQNYPNPFNPTTNFEFRIAEFGLVSLKIYDLLGREVATVIEKELPPGEYCIPFSAEGMASPHSHFSLASGVYFYQLKAGNFVETKKLLLLK